MRQKQSTLGRQIAEAQLEMDVAQSALLEAAKQRKVMEKLREREQTRWQAAQRRREQVEADEVTARAAREAALDAVI
jgi:flagellar export protein FliJ